MRILVVSNQYAPVVGGIEVLLRQLCPALAARGHDVSVLTSTHTLARDEVSEIDGITVHRVNLVRALTTRDPATLARAKRATVRIVDEVAPDVIHAHDLGANLWAVFESQPATPVITTMHIGLASFPVDQKGSMARLLRRTTWLTGVSQAVVDQAVDLMPELADRFSVIINGLPPTPEPAPPDPKGRRIVAVGRLVDQKGFDVLLHAFPSVLEREPGAELLLVGDGPERAQLEALVEDLGLGDAVRFHGAARHEDVAGLLASASVVAIPSRHEGMPLVALEAAAAGRAVVATPVQGLGDVVVDGETGVLVPPEEPGPLADALVELLSDPSRAAAYGANARARAVERFSLDQTVDAYEDLYRRFVRPELKV
ncbi:MAG: glycosyltransferase family 4 protein [Acidimicrobiia bacterium]|nr:glycosyltransferase family 4 protein [Acidimicrobiia bacterium]